MNNVKILSSPTCSYCHAAKDLLKQKGIPYQEIDISSGNNEAQQLLSQSGRRTVPQIYIDEKLIGGFAELSILLRNNQFDLTQAQPLT